MSLKDIFTDNDDLLKRALDAGDVAEVRRLKSKKHFLMDRKLLNSDFSKHSPEMTDLFINEFTDADFKRWGFTRYTRAQVLPDLMERAVDAGRADLFEAYFNAVGSLNKGSASYHIISHILKSPMEGADKARFTAMVIARDGLEQVSGRYAFVEEAAATNAPAALDLLATAMGYDLHKDNETILRHAASHMQKETARYLVEKHGANIDLAITTAHTLGQEQNWRFLEALRQEIRPGDNSAPPTIESLAAEIKSLHAKMREMKDELTALRNPEQQMQKPVLMRPRAP